MIWNDESVVDHRQDSKSIYIRTVGHGNDVAKYTFGRSNPINCVRWCWCDVGVHAALAISQSTNSDGTYFHFRRRIVQ